MTLKSHRTVLAGSLAFYILGTSMLPRAASADVGDIIGPIGAVCVGLVGGALAIAATPFWGISVGGHTGVRFLFYKLSQS